LRAQNATCDEKILQLTHLYQIKFITSTNQPRHEKQLTRQNYSDAQKAMRS